MAFAAERHIMVVAEIDMPGRMQAAIAAYPELGNGVNVDVMEVYPRPQYVGLNVGFL